VDQKDLNNRETKNGREAEGKGRGKQKAVFSTPGQGARKNFRSKKKKENAENSSYTSIGGEPGSKAAKKGEKEERSQEGVDVDGSSHEAVRGEGSGEPGKITQRIQGGTGGVIKN